MADFLKKILFFILLVSFAYADSTDVETLQLSENTGPRWVGYSWLSIEYVIGPIIASSYWWRHAFGTNPFTNVREQEHYIEDKMWHFWNGVNLSDFHNWVLRKYFGQNSPWPAMGMTFITLTAVEVLDASDAEAKWGLSVYDEMANLGGIAFWYVKYKYPELPVDVRIGIRRWDVADRIIKRTHTYKLINPDYVDDIPKGRSSHADNYSILKAELIVRPYDYFYIGFSASLKNDEDGWGFSEDLLGITAGFDVMRWYAKKYPSKYSPYIDTFGRYFSQSIAYTHWFK
ncbi:hypothetical protein J7M00_09430 [bacterium]|nr:hypothetical protein [bacterium]